MPLLKKRESLETTNARASVVIRELLGGGSQGEVYIVSIDGKNYALKWYFPEYATPQQSINLKNLVEIGAPSNRFLWPLDVVETKGLGYVMPLCEERFKNMNDLMKNKIDPSFRALCTAGYELAHNFLLLHTKGLAYEDISANNVLIDPKTGEIRICDNDNVVFDGTRSSQVLGTPRFMSPEIIRGEAMPSADSDLFSLSVLLFYILMLSHPLEGRREAEIHCFNLQAMKKIYGDEPVFIFDPNDESNRPVEGIHNNALIYWSLYPEFIRKLFTRAFTIGLREPRERVAESEWRKSFIELRDSITYCPRCGAENFFDPTAQKVPNCWNCGNNIELPIKIKIGEVEIIANNDTELYPHHLDSDRLYDFSEVVAKVSHHPNKPHLLGLTNLSQQKWVAALPDGKMIEIPRGKNVSLLPGIKIHFGTSIGEVVR